MIPTDNQQGELSEVEHGLRKVGQLVFIQEEALQLFQPAEKLGLRTDSTVDYRELQGTVLLLQGKPARLITTETCVQP